MKSSRSGQSRRSGFTLIELMVSISILAVLFLMLSTILGDSVSSWRTAESRFSQFRESQAAFETMVRRIQGAIINPYLDYEYPDGDKTKTPLKYVRSSDLHFVCGIATGGGRASPSVIQGHPSVTHAMFFHGAFGDHNTPEWDGLGNLVNSWGYYLEYGSDSAERATFLETEAEIEPQNRFRLKELQVPAELVTTFSDKLNTATNSSELYAWFRDNVNAVNSHTIAENIIALIITPLEPDPAEGVSSELSPNYYYDTRAYQHLSFSPEILERTRHKLPPLIRITLVALDPASAARIDEESPDSMPDLGISSLFRFADRYEQDMQSLEQKLLEKKLNYRIFSTTIRLRNARWNYED